MQVYTPLDHLDKYAFYRNLCLHVDYNFEHKKWMTPDSFRTIDKFTKNLLDEINAAVNMFNYRIKRKNTLKDY